jgi:hypothetical protein
MHPFLAEFYANTLATRTRQTYNGVELDVAQYLGHDDVELKHVYAPEGNRHAKDAMAFLCALADKHRVTLYAYAHPFDHARLDEQALIRWYAKFGFTASDTPQQVPGHDATCYKVTRAPH